MRITFTLNNTIAKRLKEISRSFSVSISSLMRKATQDIVDKIDSDPLYISNVEKGRKHYEKEPKI